MERRVSTRFEKYWTESGRGDGHGDVEKKDHQSYRRPYMMGEARGKEEEQNCMMHSIPLLMYVIIMHRLRGSPRSFVRLKQIASNRIVDIEVYAVLALLGHAHADGYSYIILEWTTSLDTSSRTLYVCRGGTVSSGIYRPPFCAVGTNVRRWLSYSHWQAYIHYAFIRQMASFLVSGSLTLGV